ncbi:hypothetical protein TSUD_263680 [Trifolium subterraneum]|uniref:Uncharacterized protein n=1 Tax=Trifolium subterraneum TaxID=3900 RepID=A0A2Z6N788_TRISU|nr:hypothetical protein TSUD_263680 [Trifolium subterraneum]
MANDEVAFLQSDVVRGRGVPREDKEWRVGGSWAIGECTCSGRRPKNILPTRANISKTYMYKWSFDVRHLCCPAEIEN